MMPQAGSAVSTWDKYIIFFINVILFVPFSFAVVIMAFAVDDMDPPVKSFLEFVTDVRCVLLFFSSFFAVMSVFGLFGALRENVLSLRLFILMLSLIILLQVLAIVLIFLLVYAPEVTKYVYDEDTYRKAIVTYRDPHYESLSETIDSIQLQWKCCGISNDDQGYLDWSKNEYFNCTGVTDVKFDFCSVPHTCCKVTSGDMQNLYCGQGMQQSNVSAVVRAAAIYTTGCFKAFVDSLRSNIQVIGIVAIVITIPEIVFMRLAKDLKTGIEKQRAKWLH